MGRCEMTANRKNKYTVHGALIGGPKSPSDAGDSNRAAYSEDGWNDWRADWVGSEVTLDYNAHWSMAVAQAMALPADFWLKNCDGAHMPVHLHPFFSVYVSPFWHVIFKYAVH